MHDLFWLFNYLDGFALTVATQATQNILCEELKERTMPHVIVKLYPGRSEQQKTRLAEAMVKDVVTIAK